MTRGLACDAAGIALVENGTVRYVAGLGFNWKDVPPIALGRSLIGEIVTSGKTLATNDLRQDTRCKTRNEAQEVGVAGFVGSPLRDVNDDVFGALTALMNRPHDWTSAEIASIEQAASLVAPILSCAATCASGRAHPIGRESLTPHSRILVLSHNSKATFEKAKRLARSNAPVLIQGERGTGKEVLARYIHEHSGRDGRFVPLNCGTLQEELFEAEVFGHTRGAFTGAHSDRLGAVGAAERGTLLFDEVAALSPRNQTKLLRFLQSREFKKLGSDAVATSDVRVLAATNRNLEVRLDTGFAEDLLERFTYTITMPPLRERPEELGALVERYAREIPLETGHPIQGITDRARSLLKEYDWPGNIRELHRVLAQTFIDTPVGGWVTPLVLLRYIRLPGAQEGAILSEGAMASSRERTPHTRVSKPHFIRCYEACRGDTYKMSLLLDLSRNAVQRRIRRIGLYRGSS
ncbi:MAG: sigma-54-dependent Fis family transcriptional regulator [Acidobacteria bacterium]|nr:sigma-54-dependent Fis family transcriptional regulator [Acidobacteriota bacterium]